MAMGFAPTDSTWNHEVQEFIHACQQGGLAEIRLAETLVGHEGALIDVRAVYTSRRGRRLPVRADWQQGPTGYTHMVSIAGYSLPASTGAKGFRRLASKAGLRLERGRVQDVLTALMEVYFKAVAARNRLYADQLAGLAGNVESAAELLMLSEGGRLDEPERRAMARRRRLALETLNDLAHLHS